MKPKTKLLPASCWSILDLCDYILTPLHHEACTTVKYCQKSYISVQGTHPFHSAISLLQGYGSFPLTEKQVPRGKCLLHMKIHCQAKVMHAMVLMFNVIPWWPSAHTAGTFNLDDIGQQRESVKQMCFLFSKSVPICSTTGHFYCKIRFAWSKASR